MGYEAGDLGSQGQRLAPLDRLALGLQSADSLRPGSGNLRFEAWAGNQGFGATASVEARLRSAMTVYAEGYARRSPWTSPLEYGAVGGLRVRW